MKSCSKCGLIKSSAEFSKCSRAKSGLQSKCKACVREYYEKTADKQIAANRAWRAKPENQEKARATRAKYVETEQYRDYKRSAKMRRRSLTREGDVVRMADLVAKFGDMCMHPECDRKDIEIDHVVALSKGGPHTMDNLQLLCRTHNASKSDRTIDYRAVSI